MKRLTVENVMALNPCSDYPRERVQELWGKRKSLSLRQILTLPIPEIDRIWVMTQPGVMELGALRVVVTKIVTRAVKNYALPHPATQKWGIIYLTTVG